MNTRTWTVPADHPAFAGHFPGQPIVPGVVLVDRAILLAGPLPGVCRIASAKFFSPVGPGETLQFTFADTAAGSLRCDIRCGERAVASALFSLSGTDAR